MLKKILSIFFILCLVFSLTVPCFAVLDLGYWNVDLYGFVNTVFSSNRAFRIDTAPNRLYYFRIESDPPDDNLQWQFYFDPSNVSVPGYAIYNITGDNNKFKNGGILRTNDSSYFRVYYSPGTYTNSVTCSFTCFDITDMGFTTVQEVNEFLSHYDFNGYYNTGHYSFISTDYNHFLNFYSNVFGHTFDYFGELTSTYSFVFVFIASVLAILVVIFLVVFMIKRFTGGKT